MTSIPIIIADLEGKYKHIKQNDQDNIFYIKVADYGKYLLDHEEIKKILYSLYTASKEDSKYYIEKAKEFVDKWRPLAKNIVYLAKQAGIKDDPINRANAPILQIEDILSNSGTLSFNSGLNYYYSPYLKLAGMIQEKAKDYSDLLKALALNEDKSNELHNYYESAETEWKKFETMREIKTWWAHYQIERVTYAVYDINDDCNYFEKNRIIDGLYKFEIQAVVRDRHYSGLMLLNKSKFYNWITLVHEYLISRLRAISEANTDDRKNNISAKLKYYPAENELIYKTITANRFIGLQKALLTFLNINKNVPLSVKETVEGCNKLLLGKKRFQTDKQISDTLNEIKNKMKVNKSEYFPIQKEVDQIIWIDK